MKTLKIALDWTPNVNHIGILVAKDLGFYHNHQVDVEISNPFNDNYALTPGKKLELDLADFAIAPFETVISLNNKANVVDAIAIYALLQEDLSCIASLKTSNFKRPRHLDSKTYASYKARYEDTIVKQMIKNDGGLGEINIIYPDKLGIWNTLLEGNADATWIFDNWEGIEADAKGIALQKFVMDDYAIPYGYSPCIIAKKSAIENEQNDYRSFVKATQEGYRFAQQNPTQSIKVLESYVTDYDKSNVPLEEALKATSPFFSRYGCYGFMQPERVRLFLEWLVRFNLEDQKILHQHLYTNGLFA
jgi:ABC-type nitrate/sulfonate/bicarbonate transport system substrate-binding protein